MIYWICWNTFQMIPTDPPTFRMRRVCWPIIVDVPAPKFPPDPPDDFSLDPRVFADLHGLAMIGAASEGLSAGLSERVQAFVDGEMKQLAEAVGGGAEIHARRRAG